MEHAVDSSLILRFGLKCFGVFALIFIAAVFTPKMAEYIDKWKARHRPESFEKKKTGEKYTVRSIYELPPEQEDISETVKKKAVVRKKEKK